MTAIRLILTAGCAAGVLALAGCDGGAKVDTTSSAPAAEVQKVSYTGPCDTPTGPFCNSTVPLPAGWTGNVFRLAQDYPTSIPTDQQPWLAFDPTTQPQQYLEAVLAYFYEGNIQPTVEGSFNPAANKVRGWYNAPWQDYGLNGREPIHGLTRERVNLPGELAPTQTSPWNNYAVGFYNAPGGYTIGQIWLDHGKPNPAAATSMPEGTVGAKLLFTTASVAEVPYLAGSPTWNAYVFSDVNNPRPTPQSPRGVVQVRLLQIDIAVKDSRVKNKTGWVFGTFVYGGGPGGKPGSGWTNVAPVGVMWGNDPGYSGTGPLQETWINPAVKMPHLGYQGRLNGPVDNPVSSCLSCHSTAEDPSGNNMIPPKGQDPSRWFQNLPSGTAFDKGATSTDYSLQVQVGLTNFANAQQVAKAPNDKARKSLLKAQAAEDASPPRDGD